MKKKTILKFPRTLLFLVFVAFMVSCTDSNRPLSNNASILFPTTSHDFGETPLKKEVSAIFEFENNGEELLQISEVKTSCGCAVPTWTKEVLKPSEKGSLKVTYDAEYPGRFNKTITVFYNGKNSPLELKIKGKVPYPEDKN